MNGNGLGAGDPPVLRVVLVDLARGRVNVEATLDPAMVAEAIEAGDSGPLSLAIAQALIRGVAGAAPPEVAEVLAEGLDTITRGLARLPGDPDPED